MADSKASSSKITTKGIPGFLQNFTDAINIRIFQRKLSCGHVFWLEPLAAGAGYSRLVGSGNNITNTFLPLLGISPNLRDAFPSSPQYDPTTATLYACYLPVTNTVFFLPNIAEMWEFHEDLLHTFQNRNTPLPMKAEGKWLRRGMKAGVFILGGVNTLIELVNFYQNQQTFGTVTQNMYAAPYFVISLLSEQYRRLSPVVDEFFLRRRGGATAEIASKRIRLYNLLTSAEWVVDNSKVSTLDVENVYRYLSGTYLKNFPHLTGLDLSDIELSGTSLDKMLLLFYIGLQKADDPEPTSWTKWVRRSLFSTGAVSGALSTFGFTMAWHYTLETLFPGMDVVPNFIISSLLSTTRAYSGRLLGNIFENIYDRWNENQVPRYKNLPHIDPYVNQHGGIRKILTSIGGIWWPLVMLAPALKGSGFNWTVDPSVRPMATLDPDNVSFVQAFIPLIPMIFVAAAPEAKELDRYYGKFFTLIKRINCCNRKGRKDGLWRTSLLEYIQEAKKTLVPAPDEVIVGLHDSSETTGSKV